MFLALLSYESQQWWERWGLCLFSWISQYRIAYSDNRLPPNWRDQGHVTSVVTVSKILLSVGFGRFLQEKPRFSVRFRFCLSRFPPVVNVVRLCGPLHIKPAAVRYIFLCITPVDSSKYPTACDWWRENHHLYPTSHVLRNATCLVICATDIRC